jgi:hypothetical protein
VSGSGPGVPAFVKFGRVPLGQGDSTEPVRVRHAALPLAWHVTRVLDGWEQQPQPPLPGKAAVISWWQLEVSGPLPGQPGERGRFMMEVSRYADRPGWWITTEGRPAGA